MELDDPAVLAAVSDAMSVLGDRWSLAIIAALLGGPRRYGELQGRLPGIAPNVLSGRLKRLEHEGLILATPYSEHPPRVQYALTGDAHELSDLLALLASWGARTSRGETAPLHSACGAPLEVRWWCPAWAARAWRVYGDA